MNELINEFLDTISRWLICLSAQERSSLFARKQQEFLLLSDSGSGTGCVCVCVCLYVCVFVLSLSLSLTYSLIFKRFLKDEV
jgi:hypothetical protein